MNIASQAHTRIRHKDGVTREVTATGTTAAPAERALREKLVDRASPTQQVITADTTIAKLAALWLKYLRDEDRIETTTINEYQRVLNKVVIPALGGLRLREVTTSRHAGDVRGPRGPSGTGKPVVLVDGDRHRSRR